MNDEASIPDRPNRPNRERQRHRAANGARVPAKPRPLDAAKLGDLALFYVGRFATTRAKLAHYLHRKLTERGWAGAELPDVDALVEKLVGLGAIDDAAYAVTKAQSLSRRGYGARRVADAVRAAGVAEPDRAGAIDVAQAARIDAALTFARRKRAGPFAAQMIDDRAAREKLIGAFVRAGHDARLARRIVALEPGTDPAILTDDYDG